MQRPGGSGETALQMLVLGKTQPVRTASFPASSPRSPGTALVQGEAAGAILRALFCRSLRVTAAPMQGHA